MDHNPEVSQFISKNIPWAQLPLNIKEIFGGSPKGYDKAIISYSTRNQLRFSENLVKNIRKDEGKYYEEIINYSKEHLMLYPYHLSDRVVKGLRITPFQYYTSIIEKLMDHEKSYDALPNFTAADCLRLLGIGRNQYIELMNQYRSSRKMFRRKPPRELLPTKPIDIVIEPWFFVQVGYITDDDILNAKPQERSLIDYLIDNGVQRAGGLEFDCLHKLYAKGLVYLDVPVEGDDLIVVPPLEGFVMNRVLGDYFETLLYKIFVSIDEHTTVDELATVLDIDTRQIRNAVSLYCRLGFAYKKNLEVESFATHGSWRKYLISLANKGRGSASPYLAPDEKLIADELWSAIKESESVSSLNDILRSPENETKDTSSALTSSPSMYGINSLKRIAFLYDSTLTAFLMMGNLSPGLKNHAVTMFEVGKMSDESLDSFLTELEQVSWNEGEGEAQRYFEHAKTLKKVILFLRNNSKLGSMPLDLLRCESLQNLDSLTLTRLLNKNYAMLVSMAPLSYEVRPIYSKSIPHFGPPISQVNSIWFKLFLYHITGSGPTSLLLSRGTILTELPEELDECSKYLVTSWGHDSGIIPGTNALFTLNDALTHSAVLVQAYGENSESSTMVIPFPFSKSDSDTTNSSSSKDKSTYGKWLKHPAVISLARKIDLENTCGFITMMNVAGSKSSKFSSLPPPSSKLQELLEESDGVDETEEDDEIIFVSTSVPVPPEPKNGFMNDSCAKLYRDELDAVINEPINKREKLTMPDLEKLDISDSPRVEKLNYDPRKQKIESLRLDLTLNQSDTNGEIDNSWHEEWTLLDVQFGLPLFDSTVTQIVSERIVSNNLWDEESLERLVKSNEALSQELLKFINQHIRQGSLDVINNEDSVPYPRKNFYYSDGKLMEFMPCNLY